MIQSTLYHNQRGGVLIIFSLAIPLLFACLALAVDYNRYLNARTLVVNALDQAALAAVSVDGQDREAVLREFFDSNFPDERRGFVQIQRLNAETYPPSKGRPLRLNASVVARVKNVFGGFVGMDTFTIRHVTAVEREVEQVEVALVFSAAGTMCAQKERTPNSVAELPEDVLVALRPDPNCTHFRSLKRGIRTFIDLMAENEGISTLKIGLVPYDIKVRLPDPSHVPSLLAAGEPTVGALWYGEDEDLLESPVVPLTDNMHLLRSRLNAMEVDVDRPAWSRSNIGSLTAFLMLTPSMRGYFQGGEAPGAYSDPSVTKVVVLMTDGINSGCCYTNWPESNFQNQYVYHYQPDHRNQRRLCTAMKEEGVKIFSILLDVNHDDAGGSEIIRTFAACASNVENAENPDTLRCDEKQRCYNVSSDDQIEAVYRNIARSFYIPTIVR